MSSISNLTPVDSSAMESKPNVAIENTATTTFVDDSARVETMYSPPFNIDGYPLSDQSIPEFMKKPYFILDGSWTTSSSQGSQLQTGDIASYLSSNSYWANKIQGFNLVRGTAVFRIQINANPFQQGKLLMHFLPSYEDISATSTAFGPMHNANITTMRMQPCVEIDCRDSVGIMKIPYITPYHYYDIKAQKFDWGQWFLTVLSPLQTGASGETSVNYSMWIHFEDFELAAPTVPQAGGRTKKKYKVQSGAQAVAEYESASYDASKPLSSSLAIGASVANSLSDIPILTTIMKPASWVLEASSSIASFFGWSKPNYNPAPIVASNAANRYMACSDGADLSIPLGLKAENKLTITDCNSLTDEDEMSFAFLKRVSTIINTVSWSTSQASGVSLYSQGISPQTLYSIGSKSNTSHTVTYYTGPPIYFLSQFFAFWRGSIKVTIKVAKTEFHSGRLQLTWTPVNNFSTSPTLTTGTIALREIIDLRLGNVFEFDLPYLLPYNYLPIQASNLYQPSGHLDVVILNELRCPETASSTVNLLMYFGGGDDFEFQVPCSQTTNTPVFSPQGGSELLISENVGGQPAPPVSTAFSESSIGEHFSSIKQILNRYTVVNFTQNPSYGNVISIWPWFNTVCSLPSGTGAVQSSYIGGDPFSALAQMYAYYKGSARIALTCDARECGTVTGAIDVGSYGLMAGAITTGNPTIGYVNATNFVTGTGGSYPGAAGVVNNDRFNNYGNFTVPYYSPTKVSCVYPGNTVGTYGVINNTTVDQPVSVLAMGCSFPTALASFWLARSFGDDFQLSYFIGCPPVFISST